jgi:hypothetical protein
LCVTMRLLLSCISTRHSTLKQHWSATGQQIACPLTVLGSQQKPEGDMGGLLCLIEDLGCTQKTATLSMAAGMATTKRGVFVAAFDSIYEVSPHLEAVRPEAISSPMFNALHSISRTRSGYLVASTGIDLLLELSNEGDILWEWWATDHGFTLTPTGQVRQLDKEADHRTKKYGTLQQTTHVNSAAELPDGRFLATLFHQGMVIAIDRETGAWQPIVEGLDHPHSVRVLDAQRFTVADTVHGKALLVRLPSTGKRGIVEEEVNAETNWLQDCSYDQERNAWILVDGKNSRIILRQGRSGDRGIARFDFDPEWRLYEACVV